MSIQIIEVEIPVARIAEIVVTVGPQGPPGAPIVHSATPPDDTDAVWFDTETGTLSVWYVDAWVAFDGMGSGTMSAEQITDALQGAEADPTKIGAEYLPDEILVQGIGLADTGAVALDPGDSVRMLGLNSDNQVVLHTGLDNGDDLAHLISSNQFIQLQGSFLGDDLENIESFSAPIGKIRLAAADAVVGKRISISGTVSVTYYTAGRPDESFILSFRPEETAISFGLGGVYTPLGIPTTKELLSFTLELVLSAGTTGKFVMAAANNYGGFHHKDSGGTATVASFSMTSDVGAIGTIGVDQDILISICSSDFGGVVSSFIVVGALSADIYTP